MYLNETGVLPNVVVEWVGLESGNNLGRFYIDGKRHALYILNDDKHVSFAEIADIIEKHF